MLDDHLHSPVTPVSIDEIADVRLDPFRSLKDVGQRQRGLFIIESERVLERSLTLGLTIEALLVTPSRWRRLSGGLNENVLAAFVAEPDVVDATVGFPLHRGVVALARRPAPLDVNVLLAASRRVVVLEDVVDPDNVGSVFRHAAAFGADAVLLSEHAGDPLYRKAVRTSMGWVLDVPWVRIAERDDLIGTLHRHGFVTLAFTPSGDKDLRALMSSMDERLAIVLGAESDGLLDSTMAACRERVRIDIAPHVDSLNVATAAALGMFELFRAR